MFYNVKQSEKHAMIDKSNWKSSEEFDWRFHPFSVIVL